MRGIVYKSTGNLYSVHTDSKEVYKCNIKGKFRSLGIKSTNPIAVGDQVNFEIINALDTLAYIKSRRYKHQFIIQNLA